jgi:hypothetical protein
MVDRKMRMTTDNQRRRHGISYIHECMGEKGIAKNPTGLKISIFVADA